jgi:16S rRNA C1402 (ribose-2'-O) methylase RsmI
MVTLELLFDGSSLILPLMVGICGVSVYLVALATDKILNTLENLKELTYMRHKEIERELKLEDVKKKKLYLLRKDLDKIKKSPKDDNVIIINKNKLHPLGEDLDEIEKSVKKKKKKIVKKKIVKKDNILKRAIKGEL